MTLGADASLSLDSESDTSFRIPASSDSAFAETSRVAAPVSATVVRFYPFEIWLGFPEGFLPSPYQLGIGTASVFPPFWYTSEFDSHSTYCAETIFVNPYGRIVSWFERPTEGFLLAF